MQSLEFETFAALISIDDQAQQLYGVEAPQPNNITCWIASEPGKKFSVKWHNAHRLFPLEGVVTIDGVACASYIMLDAVSFPTKPNEISVSHAWTSNFIRRDFMFAAIEVTDDDAYLHTIDQTFNFGTITLELWRYEVTDVETRPMIPQPDQTLESQLLHEKSKKAGTHHVKYGKGYFSSPPMVSVVSGHRLGNTPHVTFTFKYRPMALLIANGIVLRPIALPVNALVNVDPEILAAIRSLEAQLQNLRRKVGLDQPGETSRNHAASGRVKQELDLGLRLL
ncbi:hypothetical protein Hypma_010730 [Hypsizygus marmoreus]|uniref:DUF7918 domain-containing protein n=1 Tax=Hypsizygus marmoreus TaxID=39966 RepID=A0A369JLM5_HYPMA|nr:hypothetical protein Hypma_010730 [Hypsizygus marmoreus]